jgi:DNA polymerase-3 subunit alpha (Gram-positive type)
MTNSFQELINCQLFLPEDTAKELGSIKELRVCKTSRSMQVSVIARRMFSSQELRKIENTICEALNLSAVKIEASYAENLFQEDCLEFLLESLRERSIPVNGFFENCQAKIIGSNLQITLQNGGLELLSRVECERHLSEIIHEKFGLSIGVEFIGMTAVDSEHTVNQRLRDQESLIKEENKTVKGKNFTFKLDGQPLVLNSMKPIYGKPPVGKLVPITEINENSGTVTIWGDVFGCENRETKDGRNIITSFLVTDYTGSAMIKIFADTAQASAFLPIVGGIENKKCFSVVAHGRMEYDKYDKDIVLRADSMALVEKEMRSDKAEKKRIELHAHTKMSALDGLSDTRKLIQKAAQMGHEAIAITDHGVLQAFPDAASAAKECAENNSPIRVIYGLEGYLIDDTIPAVTGSAAVSLNETLIVFDIETTGFSRQNDRIIEIGAVKIENQEITDAFNVFVNPKIPLPSEITALTGITESMLADAAGEKEALLDFYEFCGGDDAVLIAHNAAFDTSFLKAAAKRNKIYYRFTVIDTLVMARSIYTGLKNYKLATVASNIGIHTFDAHRASEDAKVLGKIFLDMLRLMQTDKSMEKVTEINERLGEVDYKKLPSYHFVALAKDDIGLKNLYRVVTKSHINHFYKTPRITKSNLIKHREGLLLGSACESGELFRAILERRSWRELCEIAKFYDYLEIQPVENNAFLIRNGRCKNTQELMELNQTVVKLGEKLDIPVAATGDVHFVEPQDAIFRSIIMTGSKFSDADMQAPLYLKTTNEMLEEFSYLGEEKAIEVVVGNPIKISQMINELNPIPKGKYPPTIDGSDGELQRKCWDRARGIYGESLPEIVEVRLKKEIDSIVKNGFSVMYIAAQKLVEHSEKLGYFVGSRGSVGSSFAATMLGISEVNPLPPHYFCPSCKFSEFFDDGTIASGYDLPDKACPICQTALIQEGQDIPFETFLGFGGDKQPDIDLNFSGECQSDIHRFTVEMFGETQVFKAGTISTVAKKTAYGYVKKYLETHGLTVHRTEEERLVQGCMDVKKTTGQHPGGMVVIPQGMDAMDFTPLQYPADRSDSGMMTTHFDFHALHDTILKLDELGHDVPTMYKYLEEYSGKKVINVPSAAPEVMSLFTSTEALGVCEADIDCTTGTLGLPEMGTSFVRQMLLEAKPEKFSDLVQISGLSHGTNVWIANAQDLIRSGVCGISEVIGTRDSIMTYLMHRGLEPKTAFDIMEIVRRGQAKEKLTSEMNEMMKIKGVPQWYIDSCLKIKYMFPKAHAAAYVLSAMKLGWYKIHHPIAFYATYFTVRPDSIEADVAIKGQAAVRNRLHELRRLGNDRSDKDDGILYAMNVVLEMMARGFEFLPVSLQESEVVKYKIENGKIRLPFISVKGVGRTAAEELYKVSRQNTATSIDEFATLASVSRPVIDSLKEMRVFGNMPENSQITLF